MTTREDKILALTSAASRLARLSRLRDRDTEAAEAADAVDKAVSDLATWPETISADLICSVAGYLMDRADALDMIVKRAPAVTHELTLIATGLRARAAILYREAKR